MSSDLRKMKEHEVYRTAISRFLSQGRIPTLADLDHVYRAAHTYIPGGFVNEEIVREIADNRMNMRKVCP